MKKALVFVLILVIAIVFTACGKRGPEYTKYADVSLTTGTTTTTETELDTATETESETEETSSSTTTTTRRYTGGTS